MHSHACLYFLGKDSTEHKTKPRAGMTGNWDVLGGEYWHQAICVLVKLGERKCSIFFFPHNVLRNDRVPLAFGFKHTADLYFNLTMASSVGELFPGGTIWTCTMFLSCLIWTRRSFGCTLHFKLELKASRTPQAGERLLTSSRRSRDPEIEEEFSTQMANV